MRGTSAGSGQGSPGRGRGETMKPASRRLSVRGFLPLPPIMASPVGSPSASLSSTSSVYVVVSTPTWISTPPTPTKLTRHSSACRPRRTASATPLSPSASFSASMHTHAMPRQTPRLKKCISVPNILGRARTLSGPHRLEGNPPVPSSLPSDQHLDIVVSHMEGDGRRTRDKAIFHLSSSNTDTEDEVFHSAESRPQSSGRENSPDGSWSDHSPEGIWEQERVKDALRRFHALKELLSTEAGYLTHLKAFVVVYLRNLPTLVTNRTPTYSTFGRASASFTSAPWASSYAQLHPGSLPTSATTDGSGATLLASNIKEVPKPNIRFLFTDIELEVVTRNAEDILQLHERFVRELQHALKPLGFIMEDDIDEPPTPEQLHNLETAIRLVSAKFATEASRFNAYQVFCAGHSEAIDLVRRVSQQYPMEWESFEQRCSAMVGDFFGGKIAESEPPALSPDTFHLTPFTEDRARALSLTSLDSAVRTLRLRSPCNKDPLHVPEAKRESTNHRIAFMDYLIKPIQRICKYPLLFDQVLSAKALRALGPNDILSSPHVDVIVQSAAQAMRHVASSVDEARHRQDVAIQSSLICSRVLLGSPGLPAPTDTTVQVLTAEFLSSLGTCLLAGSLDVMHHHPLQPFDINTNLKAKYFGAFLYPGGYFILVRIGKGRKYEPKHWFNLSDFIISDVEDEEALLPYSIRATHCEHQFELAASCQREKDIWLAAIHSSIRDNARWKNEPTPSHMLDEKGAFVSPSGEMMNGLPTILSVSELPNDNSDPELSEPFVPTRAPAKGRSKLRKSDAAGRSEAPSMPSTSRRSSTTSVKAIFGPLSDAESIVIRRSSPMARLQVDQALQDVISPSCLAARTNASKRDAELFRSGTTALSRTKSRLSKHESIRVPRSRTSEHLDAMNLKVSQHPSIAVRRNAKKLSISSAPPAPDERKFFSRTSTSASIATTSPLTSSSHLPTVPSLTSSNASSSSSSSATLLTPSGTPDREQPHAPKTPRTLVRGMKDLFSLRSAHPLPASPARTSDPALEATPALAGTTSPSTPPQNRSGQRWRLGTIRRRPKTAPSGDTRSHFANSLEPSSNIVAA